MRIKLPDDLKGQKISLPGERKPSKYRAQRTEYNGRWYDSMAEALHAEQLDMCMKAGIIAWWLPQVPIMIGEPGIDKPYRVDFLVAECPTFGGLVEVHAEDVKGADTVSFRRHVKQWRLRGPFPLHVIRGDDTEIIEGGGG